MIREMKVLRNDPRRERIELESDTHQAVVALTWHDRDQNWLLTAYEKATPARPLSARRPGDGENGSTRLGEAQDIDALPPADKVEAAMREQFEDGPEPYAAPAPLQGFDTPDDVAAARLLDSLEHDLRMMMNDDPATTVRLSDEGDVVSLADLLADLDADEATVRAARACMTPGDDA
jgi:hypothetical protein